MANATSGDTLESLTPDELAALGIQPVNKILVANGPSLGFSPSAQTEGLALLDDGSLVLLNDNDYAAPTIPTNLGLLSFSGSSGLDPSDDDGQINIANFPVFGLRQPDGIASFSVGGETFYITANEGDGRDDETDRIDDLALDPLVFPDAAQLQGDDQLGRLEVSIVDGDIDGDGLFEQLFAFGSRSFSIFDAVGNLVFDSGDAIEQITASTFPADFNANNDENGSFDNRSDDAGPEPEGVTIGQINIGGEERIFAFIGLERIGGVLVYEVTNPNSPEFVQYLNTRDFSGDAEAGTAGDLGPEGLTFISAANSPDASPLLVVANEVSGTTTIFEVTLVTPTIIINDNETFTLSEAITAPLGEPAVLIPGNNAALIVTDTGAIAALDTGNTAVQSSGDTVTIDNQGTIAGALNGISTTSNNLILTNSGTITSDSRAIDLLGGDNLTITNSGTLLGTGDQRNGTIYSDNAASNYSFNNSGLVDAGEGNQGAAASFSFDPGDVNGIVTLINSGTLQGRGQAAANLATAGDGLRLEGNRS
ncbi:MAG: hypothetical protein HC890_18015, partial [Chloroflexaceae bacterium]|nr:hypothetical protein [Chloroflexaceae bacterium]